MVVNTDDKNDLSWIESNSENKMIINHWSTLDKNLHGKSKLIRKIVYRKLKCLKIDDELDAKLY